jgi:surface protein
MSRLFFQENLFNEDIGNWDVSKVTDMRSIFVKATSFNQDLSPWNVDNVANYADISRDTSQ